MKRTHLQHGFTIVELLTVMAVIALLIGLLVPALSMVKDRATDMQQLAQFHSITSGLEMYKADFGDYPESFDNLAVTTPAAQAPLAPDAANYGGAHKLAEAMVGYDLLGVHPRTGFRADGENYFPPPVNDYRDVYDTRPGTNGGIDAYPVYFEATGEANIDARRGPYVELENANAFQMGDVYGAITPGFNRDNVVLCDVYARSRPSGRKTGTPILYFRANTRNRFQNFILHTTPGADIYNLYDNYELLSLGEARTGYPAHEVMLGTIDEAFLRFEDLILNQQVLQSTVTTANTLGVRRPYRADSFILWSAGKDGVFGTGDDLFNFSKDTE